MDSINSVHSTKYMVKKKFTYGFRIRFFFISQKLKKNGLKYKGKYGF